MFTSTRTLTVLAALALTAAPAVTAVAATHTADSVSSAASAIAPSAAAATTSASVATSAAFPRVYRERHPEIRRAINALQHARSDLQNAATDFGGHRADALAATDNAIHQLQLALQYDR
ncbi:MAG TPA: hypothetical protein VGD56_12505 [Gemmatirosa sp.]